jgi:hypothetical protein
MSQSLIQIDALYSAFVGEKEKKIEMARVFFPQGQTHLAGCAVWDFCSY